MQANAPPPPAAESLMRYVRAFVSYTFATRLPRQLARRQATSAAMSAPVMRVFMAPACTARWASTASFRDCGGRRAAMVQEGDEGVGCSCLSFKLNPDPARETTHSGGCHAVIATHSAHSAQRVARKRA